MSGPFDEFGQADPWQEDEEDQETALPPAVRSQENHERHLRSRADDLLDAAEGSKEPVSYKRTCNACGSDKLEARGSGVQGGTTTLKCLNCRVESPMATVRSAVEMPVDLGNASAGPFYSATSKGPPNPNMPRFKAKSRGKKKQ